MTEDAQGRAARDTALAGAPNLVWILIDGMRATPCKVHPDRDPLPFLEELRPQSVSFSNAITSAPSTLMSISAMLTGLHAYQLGRTFADFEFDPARIRSLPQVLAERAYVVNQATWYPYSRDRLGCILPSVARKYWAKGMTFRDRWNNDQIIDAIGRMLSDGTRSPRFLFAHLNMYSGQQTEGQVQRLIRVLQPLLSNSVLVVCSDHGFPVPPREMRLSEWRAHLASEGHDCVLSQENIQIPLLIRASGCAPRRVDCPVSSIDLAASLLDLLGLESDERLSRQSRGMNISRLVRGAEPSASDWRRYVRTDNRYFLQPRRLTSIVRYPYKLVFRHDDASTEFELIGPREAESEGEFTAQAWRDELLAELRRSTAELDRLHLELIGGVVLGSRRIAGLDGKRVLIIDQSGWRSVDPLRDVLAKGVHARCLHVLRFSSANASPAEKAREVAPRLASYDALLVVGSRSNLRSARKLAAAAGVEWIQLGRSVTEGTSDWLRAKRRVAMFLRSYWADPATAYEDLLLAISDKDTRRQVLDRALKRVRRRK